MCGIAGIIRFDGAPISKNLLEQMTASISHRGPNDIGIEIGQSFGFGHRRLSIIDLAGGSQPMKSEDGSIWLSYNGEIYNYKLLRAELENLGHTFTTNSDTEVVLRAYQQWGKNCIRQFRGMFSFAILDQMRGALFLARDHFGIKPLFFVSNRKYFAFASEIQSLLKIPEVELEIDLEAVDQYLCLQYVPGPNTAYKAIKKLLPAHVLSVSLSGDIGKPEKYWDLHFKPDDKRCENEWIEVLDSAIRESVQAHLVSDVPFGAFLSGGVDSSLVLAYMSQLVEDPVTAFTIGFDEPDFNEVEFARFAARQCGADHHVEVIKHNALQILPDLVRHFGDLFGDSSAIPTYYVSKIASKNFSMVLSGDGADESFAGYWSHKDWMEALHHNENLKQDVDLWLTFVNQIGFSTRESLWRPEHRGVCPSPLNLFADSFKHAQEYSPSAKAQYVDIKTYLPHAILAKVDITSMMHGLEVRTPFVDTKLVELAFTIPEKFNISRSSSGKWEGKNLLKKVAGKYYPAEFLDRPKMGFAPPLQSWFGFNDDSMENIEDRLLASNSRLNQYFDPARIRQFITNKASRPLWLLLVLDEWLKQTHEYSLSRK